MDILKMTAPCLLGLEGLVADELRQMGAQKVEAQNGRVLFEGGFDLLARANICSRYSERIQILMGSFKAYTFSELFDNVKAIPWERFIGKKDAFPVKGRSLSSKLSSVPDCQSIIKKAVVERLKQKYMLSWFEETGDIYQIQFLFLKDTVIVTIDTSGAGLHKRGYRAESAEAPIKETLAAAMADISHVRDHHTVVDPFCGSGTILIESALKAMNIAPGLKRTFSAEHFGSVPKNVWNAERERAASLIKNDCAFSAVGYDIDSSAVQLTLSNAKKAGLSGRITAFTKSIGNFKSEEFEKATVICNPPYGERLLDLKSAQELYKEMGQKFKTKNGWSYTVISPDDSFEELFGRRADKRRKLYNGMIKCQVYMYYKFNQNTNKNMDLNVKV